MRFHQAISFLTVPEMIDAARASDELGYDGIYLSDHLFNPRRQESRYTYSTAEDGSAPWSGEQEWPDAMCMISAMAAVTTCVTFTTGVYVAPVRDLVTVARSVGTAAVISENRVRLGVGVGWCKEEFLATGQDFHTRGKRLDEMIPALRSLWAGGWVEHHGAYYDVPECQMNPAPTRPVPIYGGGDSVPALRRATELCDGWIATGVHPVDLCWEQVGRVKEGLARAGRSDDDFAIYLAPEAVPDPDLYRKFEDGGVTDILCAPWISIQRRPGQGDVELRAARIASSERFRERVIEPMR